MKLYIQILISIIFCAVSLATISAQEKIVKAYDSKCKVEPDKFFPGTFLEDDVLMGSLYIAQEIYTDRVMIRLDGNKELAVLFLSEENKEVALSNHNVFDYYGTEIIEQLPEYIDYNGILYKVVELRGVYLSSPEIVIPNTVRSIHNPCFFKVEKIQFGNSLEIIGKNCIYMPEMLNLKLPNSLQRILQSGISGYDYEEYKLETIEFSPNIYSIECDNFNYLPYVEEIKLPRKLSYLGNNCFNNLRNLKRVYVGKYIEYLGNCFNECPLIEEIVLDKLFPIKCENCFNCVDRDKCIVKVKRIKDANREFYSTGFWADFKVVEIDESGVERVVNDPGNKSMQIFDLMGRRIEPKDNLSTGEIYIEQNSDNSVKKIIR